MSCGPSIFQSSAIVQVGRTEPAQQLHVRDTVTVEDVAEDALPNAAADGVQSGQKYQQIGTDACLKLQESHVGNLTLSGKGGIYILDLSAQSGHMFDAFIKFKSASNVPCLYFGACDDDIGREWFVKTKVQHVADEFIAGSVVIPGYNRPPTTMPTYLLETQPPIPKLNVMTAGPGFYPIIPEAVLELWATHPVHGNELQKIMDGIVEVWGPMPEAYIILFVLLFQFRCRASAACCSAL